MCNANHSALELTQARLTQFYDFQIGFVVVIQQRSETSDRRHKDLSIILPMAVFNNQERKSQLMFMLTVHPARVR
jgi:hypothetical protein